MDKEKIHHAKNLAKILGIKPNLPPEAIYSELPAQFTQSHVEMAAVNSKASPADLIHWWEKENKIRKDNNGGYYKT
jgi:hypothetical protein